MLCKKNLWGVVLVLVLVVLGALEIISSFHTDTTRRVQDNIIDLHSNDLQKVKGAIVYLLNHPMESLPYLILETDNSEPLKIDKVKAMQLNIPYGGERSIWIDAEQISDIACQLLTHLYDMLSMQDIMPQAYPFYYKPNEPKISREERGAKWRAWYRENASYLYLTCFKDYEQFTINYLAKRYKIPVRDWEKLPSERKQVLTEQVSQQEDAKYAKLGLIVRPPTGETKERINRVVNGITKYLTEPLKKAKEGVETYEGDELEESINVRGFLDEELPGVLYIFNRNFNFYVRMALAGRFPINNTELSKRLILQIINDPEMEEIIRYDATRRYIGFRLPGWQELLVNNWIAELQNGNLNGLYQRMMGRAECYTSVSSGEGRRGIMIVQRELLYNKTKSDNYMTSWDRGKMIIPLFIKALNTPNALVRQEIGRQLWRVPGHFITWEKRHDTLRVNQRDVSMEAVNEKLIKETLANLSAEQQAAIARAWQEWWENYPKEISRLIDKLNTTDGAIRYDTAMELWKLTKHFVMWDDSEKNWVVYNVESQIPDGRMINEALINIPDEQLAKAIQAWKDWWLKEEPTYRSSETTPVHGNR